MQNQPTFRLAADSPHRPDRLDPVLAAKLAAERAYQERLDAQLRAQEWSDDDF